MDLDLVIELSQKTPLPLEIWIMINRYYVKYTLLQKLGFPVVVFENSAKNIYKMNLHKWYVYKFHPTSLVIYAFREMDLWMNS